MTALTILLVSLFILTPLGVVLAVINDSGFGTIAGIIATTIVHTTFWVTFGQYVAAGYHEIFSLAIIYEFVTICGTLAAVIEGLELR